MLHLSRSAWIVGVAMVLAAGWLVADEPPAKPPKPGVEKPHADKPDLTKPTEPLAPVEPFVVPDGTPAELVKYIQGLPQYLRPTSDKQTIVKVRKAVLEAAEKILAAECNDEEREFAVQAKMNMLDTPQEVAAFAAELKKAGHARLTRMVAGYHLQMTLPFDPETRQKDAQKSVEKILKFLGEAPPQPVDTILARVASELSEVSGDVAFAVETHRTLARIFAASPDPQLVRFGKTLEGVGRRAALVGNRMKIQGKTLAGETFDGKKYAGKIVLVSVWATWHPSSIAELPNLKRNYERYHARGFDIIAISIDRLRKPLEEFVKRHEIPWTVLFDEKGENVTATNYGGVGTAILVDRDGKVVANNAAGENLGKELEKLLGPAEEKKAAAKKSL